MLDMIKKGMLAGLGAAVVTREKIKEKTQYLVDEGKLSVDETERLTKELMDEGEIQWGEIKDEIVEMIRTSLDKLDIGYKKDFADLKSRLVNIEQRLSMIEERQPGPDAGEAYVSGTASA